MAKDGLTSKPVKTTNSGFTKHREIINAICAQTNIRDNQW